MKFGHSSELQHEYEFTAVHDNDTPENERYSKYTPVGSLKFTVTNPAVSFEPGKQYYLDFTPAD
jgi:hypothetical protein